MKADRPLWIDAKGNLCDRPPSTGYKIAGNTGQDISGSIMQKFGLSIAGGKVVQHGEAAKSPESTPPPMIADRELFADKDGELFDEPQGTGIKIADPGKKIPVEYIRRYSLAVEGGKVVQKKKPDQKKKEPVENKAVDKMPNKGARGTGGLVINNRRGTRSSKGAS